MKNGLGLGIGYRQTLRQIPTITPRLRRPGSADADDGADAAGEARRPWREARRPPLAGSPKPTDER